MIDREQMLRVLAETMATPKWQRRRETRELLARFEASAAKKKQS